MKKEIYLPISNRLLALILFVSILAGWFYWFQYRPSKIVSSCNDVVMESRRGRSTEGINTVEAANFLLDIEEVIYEGCLREGGLNK